MNSPVNPEAAPAERRYFEIVSDWHRTARHDPELRQGYLVGVMPLYFNDPAHPAYLRARLLRIWETARLEKKASA